MVTLGRLATLLILVLSMSMLLTPRAIGRTTFLWRCMPLW